MARDRYSYAPSIYIEAGNPHTNSATAHNPLQTGPSPADPALSIHAQTKSTVPISLGNRNLRARQMVGWSGPDASSNNFGVGLRRRIPPFSGN
jgi:hypothetical protein